jgi:hypothetical protein
MKMEETSVVINILTAMITPAVLILACGSLSLTTSQRLNRSITRTRNISEDIKEIKQGVKIAVEGEQFMLYRQMLNAAKRSVLLQRVMTLLYIAISFFIATSLLIGLFEILNREKTWILIGLPLLGSLALLAASIILILEARLALADVNNEMNFRRSSKIEFSQKGSNI